MNETVERLMVLADGYARHSNVGAAFSGTADEFRADLRAELERLFAQSAAPADARDAARYRWLRQWAGRQEYFPDLADPQSPKEMDDAIDAQIAAEKESK